MDQKKFSFTYNPKKKGLRKILGDLETDIMEIMWDRGEMTVRQVKKILTENRDIAYTTVMTVIGRLAEKDLLQKVKDDGTAFVYRATSSKEDFTNSTIKKIISGLLGDFTSPVISQFVESMDDTQHDEMKELARLIEEKLKEKGKNDV